MATKHYSPKEHIGQIQLWQGETWKTPRRGMAIKNSILGIKSRFFAQTLRIMSYTSRKNFRIFYRRKIYFLIFY
jgi:hypothetical protein